MLFTDLRFIMFFQDIRKKLHILLSKVGRKFHNENGIYRSIIYNINGHRDGEFILKSIGREIQSQPCIRGNGENDNRITRVSGRIKQVRLV